MKQAILFTFLMLPFCCVGGIAGDLGAASPSPARIRESPSASHPSAISYQLQMLPGQVFHAKYYYWTLNNPLSASLGNDPAAPWLSLSDAAFTSQSCTDVKTVGYNFSAPTSPGVYTAVISDNAGNFPATNVTLLVTPAPSISVDSMVVNIRQGQTFVKRDTLFWHGWSGLGCTTSFKPGQTTRLEYFTSPQNAQFSIIPTTLTIGSDTVVVEKRITATSTGTFTVYEVQTSEWGSYVGFTRWIVTVTPATATEPEATQAPPTGFALRQNFPNPFNPSTTIRYVLAFPSEVRLAVYDVLGRLVSVVDAGPKGPGSYAVTFNADGLSSGIYLTTLEVTPHNGTPYGQQTRPMILLK